MLLGHQLRLEQRLAVTRDGQRQFAEIALEGFVAVTVTGITAGVDDRSTLAMPQVLGHLGFQRTLDQHLGELLEQAVFANQIFRFLVIDQQAVGELDELRVGLRPLGAFHYGHGYSLRLAVSCQMTVYTKLKTPSQFRRQTEIHLRR
ncbi:hypothetical protein D9M71_686570 [compost metagenome]